MGLMLLLGGIALAVGAGVFYYHESSDAPAAAPRRRRGRGMLAALEHDPSRPEEYSPLREPWYESLGLETRDPRDPPDPRFRRRDEDEDVRLEDSDIRH